jgi:hypothetical protein
LSLDASYVISKVAQFELLCTGYDVLLKSTALKEEMSPDNDRWVGETFRHQPSILATAGLETFDAAIVMRENSSVESKSPSANSEQWSFASRGE